MILRRKRNPAPTTERTVTLRITADEGSSYTLMVEPWGMTYPLASGQAMFVEIADPDDHIGVDQWDGGVSIMCPGQVVTRDAGGSELHRF